MSVKCLFQKEIPRSGIFYEYSIGQIHESISFLRELERTAERLNRPFLLGKRIINILESKNISKDPAMTSSPDDDEDE